jgi:hypothetical protein
MNRIVIPSADQNPPRRGDALKTVLIVVAILGGLMMLSCLGVGVAGYFWIQKNFANVAVTDPVKVRQITAELTDITIPAEFVPQTASQIFGVNTVIYQWCPSGTCPTEGDDDQAEYTAGNLTLTTFETSDDSEVEDQAFWEESFTENNLKERFRDFTRDVKEFTIRGKTCKFFVVKGEEIPWDVDEPEMAADDSADPGAAPITTTEPATIEPAPAATDPAPAKEPATPAPAAIDSKVPAKPGRQIVWIEGVFPGAKGSCTLNLYLLGTDYDEAKILGMLQSIK